MTEVFRIAGTTVNLEELPALLKRYRLLPQLYRNIIIEAAIKDIDCDPQERQQAIQSFLEHHQIKSEAECQAWLERHCYTQEQLEAEALRPLQLDKYKEATFGPKVEAYFMGRKPHLDRVVFSLIRVPDQGLAQELYFRIQEGEQTFADLAREYSKGPEANTGGVIGPTPLSNPHPAIARMLSVSQPGQLWAPVKLDEWVVILRLEKLIPANYDEVRPHLLDEMLETWLQQQVQEVIQQNSQVNASDNLVSAET